MDTKQIEQLKAIIKKEEKQYDFNDFIVNYTDDVDLSDITEIDDLEEYFKELDEDDTISGTEVIYYSNAMEYLKKNDPSLNESIEIASELGYTTENLNSELLASLLKSRNNKNDYSEFIISIISQMKEVF